MLPSRFDEDVQNADGYKGQPKQVLVHDERLSVLDLPFQVEDCAQVNQASDDQKSNEAFQHPDSRGCCLTDCAHKRASSDKPGILSSFLEIITDPVVTFISGFAAATYAANEIWLEAINTAVSTGLIK